eukprot:gene13662-16089_t
MSTTNNIAARQVNTAQIPNFKKWLIVYPQHINSELTKDGGRKTPKALSVKNPSPQEIAIAAGALNLQAVLEAHKAYPKDFFLRGRVRIQLETDGVFIDYVNPEITSKTKLLLALAAKIKETTPVRPEAFNPLSMIATAHQPAVKKEKEDKKKKKGGK